MSFTFRHHYRIVHTEDEDRGPWKASTVAYLYDIDNDVGPLLEYHWHPVGHHVDPRPHLHIRTREGQRVRLPAGRVALEEIIKVLHEQYRVPVQRLDWREVLEESQSAFEKWRTWP